MIKKAPPRRRVGRPSLRDGEVDRSAALVAAAIELVAKEGFEGLRTREVTRRAGVNIATLHYYFPTKEDLIRAMARHLSQHFVSVHGPLQTKADGALRKLEQELSDARFYFERHRDLLLAMDELSRRARRDKFIRGVLEPLYWHWRNGLREMIATGQKEGVFRRGIQPDRGAALFVAAMNGAYAHVESLEELEPVLRELQAWLKI